MSIPSRLKRPRVLLALSAGLVLLVYLANTVFGSDEVPPRYVLSAVAKGTLVTSVSGTGQVASSSQVDIKAETSGKVLSVDARAGDKVSAGKSLVSLDARDARNAVRDAENSLASARVALDKLKRPAETYEILQAENAVEKAKNDLEKVKKPDESSVLQARNALEKAENDLAKLKLTQVDDAQSSQDAKKKAEDAIVKAYDDALTAVSDALATSPALLSALDEILYDDTIDGSTQNAAALTNTIEGTDKPRITTFRTTAEESYRTARIAIDANRVTFDTISRTSDRAAIEALLEETIVSQRALAQAVQGSRNYLDAWVDIRTGDKLSVFPQVTEYQDDLSGDVTSVNADLTALLGTRQDLTDNRTALSDAERALSDSSLNAPRDLSAAENTVAEKQAALLKLSDPTTTDVRTAELAVTEKEIALGKLRAGADSLDLKSQELSVQQRANALSDAREKLSDANVKAPFDGTVASVAVKKGETISSGGAIATLIADDRVAEIALNEVDIAKVRVGQKATLSFDAVDALQISGQVAEVDEVGTVSQGVVTYGVKVLFDTLDPRVKPGMSVSASVIIEAKPDVLLVPSSAVKSSAAGSYVEIPDEEVDSTTNSPTGITLSSDPKQQPVEVGSSNDTSTEIVSGLNVGDQIITRTITASTATTATQGQNIFQLGGGNRGATGGNATFRAGAGAAVGR